jgi:hypothetical protein
MMNQNTQSVSITAPAFACQQQCETLRGQMGSKMNKENKRLRRSEQRECQLPTPCFGKLARPRSIKRPEPRLSSLKFYKYYFVLIKRKWRFHAVLRKPRLGGRTFSHHFDLS